MVNNAKINLISFFFLHGFIFPPSSAISLEEQKKKNTLIRHNLQNTKKLITLIILPTTTQLSLTTVCDIVTRFNLLECDVGHQFSFFFIPRVFGMNFPTLFYVLEQNFSTLSSYMCWSRRKKKSGSCERWWWSRLSWLSSWRLKFWIIHLTAFSHIFLKYVINCKYHLVNVMHYKFVAYALG